jgi:RNA polymerase sigma-70 factor (ECF subfamily)
MIQTMTQGDPATGLEAAVRAHERELVSFAARLLGHEDQARDSVQDAFLKAHVAVRGGAAPAAFRPWLYRLVYHAAVDRLRRGSLEKRARPRGAPSGPGPSAGEPLEALLASLDSPYREILLLRYAYDFSYAEMEAILGIASGTLRVYAARALEMVHARLKEDAHGL